LNALFAKRCDRCFDLRSIAGTNCNITAFSGESLRDCETDSLGTASDDRFLAS